MRSVAFSAGKTAMRLLVQLALLARKSRLARFHVRVVLHLRRKYEIAIFARRRDRHVTWNGVERQFHFGEELVTQKSPQ